MKQLQELKSVIDDIITAYNEVCMLWERQTTSTKNLRKMLVCDLGQDNDKLQYIYDYAEFLSSIQTEQLLVLSGGSYDVRTRIKNANSIYSKYMVYLNKVANNTKGTLSVSKCFNDLFGLRIITDVCFDHDAVQQYMADNFPALKCINSSKGDYTATHIYIKRTNKDFQWELQLWARQDAIRNYQSHKEHKQQYTQWEQLFQQSKEVCND